MVKKRWSWVVELMTPLRKRMGENGILCCPPYSRNATRPCMRLIAWYVTNVPSYRTSYFDPLIGTLHATPYSRGTRITHRILTGGQGPEDVRALQSSEDFLFLPMGINRVAWVSKRDGVLVRKH